MAEDDPTAIRSLAVSPDDAVNAYVYGRENPGDAVLRVTPPFHGRMRARIHVYRVDDAELTGAVHVSPEAVIADDVVAAYPRFEETLEAEDEDAERIRERYAQAIEAWRARARESIVDVVTIQADGATHQVEVKPLG
ncbi:hypothetical protein [Halosolutus gelatinilyticus]|uniref:hypothetical protein n=1 Tax=Halosolutus gelatinilyticus TaxID=2931975 RepID=UPI001FF232A7|nr:hypothetical protein [Halosolutus gelatinilyticus]